MPSQSLSREKRLQLPSEFAQVRETGAAQRGALLVLGVKEDEATRGFRIGFVTSKRVGGAVERNRVRRRLREIVRRRQAQLRGGLWLVLVARPAAARASYQALEDEWLRLAKRASILAA